MSGFEFYLTCETCGLTSGTYPWRFDRIVEPTSLVLPAANRVRKAFERICIPLDEKLPESQIAALAAAHSTPERTVYVPYFAQDEGVALQPEPSCPRCGSTSVIGRFGHHPEPDLLVLSLDDVIDASRTLADGALLQARLTDETAGIRCQRSTEEGKPRFDWSLDRVGDTDVKIIADELISKLVARGSTCDEPVHRRAFTRFREWPASTSQ